MSPTGAVEEADAAELEAAVEVLCAMRVLPKLRCPKLNWASTRTAIASAATARAASTAKREAASGISRYLSSHQA